jgi:hypothetical protein
MGGKAGGGGLMSVPTVDEQAMRAEFEAIRLLMSSVISSMSPQTWQGGAAVRFTADLQAGNSALAAMLAEVCQDVAAVNKKPFGPPPTMPRVQAQPTTAAVASVSPNGLKQLEYALRTVAGQLPGHARRIIGLLSVAGGHANTRACDRVADWCGKQAGTMQQRIDYALASDKVNPISLNFTAQRGMVQVPDVDRFGPVEMRQLGQLEAQLFTTAFTHPDGTTQKILAQVSADLRANTGSPDFLTSFFGTIPEGSAGKLAFLLHQQHSNDKAVLDANDKLILGDLGTALAALSRRTGAASQTALWRALGSAGSDMPGQGLLVKYSNGKWGSVVLADLGQAALRWRQQFHSYRLAWRDPGFGEPQWFANGTDNGHGWAPDDWGISMGDRPTVQEYDPALNILSKIRQNGDSAAARLLALGKLPPQFASADPRQTRFKPGQFPWISRLPGQTYTSLLLAPDWIDGGRQAGGVIDLATQRGKGDDAQAADIARQVVWSVSRWNGLARDDVHKFFGKNIVRGADGIGEKGARFDLGPWMKQDLLKVAVRYMPSFSISATSAGDPDTAFFDEDPVTGLKNFRVSGWTAQQFLSTFSDDEKGRQSLLLAAQIYNRLLITQEARGGAPEMTLADALTRAGRLEGNILHGLQIGFVNQGKTEQEAFAAAQKDNEQVRSLVGGLVASLPGAGLLPGGTIGDPFSTDPNDLMDKATQKEIDDAGESGQTISHAWGDSVRESLAIALHNDGVHRNPLFTIDGRSYHVDGFFKSNGQVRTDLRNDQHDALLRWAEHHMSNGQTGSWYHSQAENAFNNTSATPLPPAESLPPPTIGSP